MKRFSIICLSFLLIFSCIMPVCAAEQEGVIWHQETLLENGIKMIDEVTVQSHARSANKDYTRSKVIYSGDTVIAVISLYGEFKYDGTIVSVVSKSVTQTDTYEGWSYKQNAFTSSGGTITLDAKLTKLLVLSIPFTMTLSCDKNGNLSYT